MVKRHADHNNACHLLLSKPYYQLYRDFGKDKYNDVEDVPYSLIDANVDGSKFSRLNLCKQELVTHKAYMSGMMIAAIQLLKNYSSL